MNVPTPPYAPVRGAKSVPQKHPLTDLAIKKFPVPKTGSTTYWDAHTPGFGLRVSAGGAKSFIVLIGSGRRQALGRYPAIGLSNARTEASRILAERTLGNVRPTRTAFDDVKNEYLRDCAGRLKPRTLKDYAYCLNRHYCFARKSVADIKAHEMVRILNKLNATPCEKHHAYAIGRAFFRWCRAQRYIDRNPMEDLGIRPYSVSRDRVLSDRELGCVLTTALAGTTSFHRIVSLLCLLGQRRGEIGSLEWTWINLQEQYITLPKGITKNNREHRFPIGSMTVSVLASVTRWKDSPYVFPAARTSSETTTVFNGWGNPKAAFDKELKEKGCEVAPWTLHDLRRTLRTNWAELGIIREVAEKYINHVSGTGSAIEAIYNRAKYKEPMRSAVTLWESHLAMLLKDN
jgi:integrase